jgi:hypothetical protein
MGRASKRRRSKREGPPRRNGQGVADPGDPLEDVFESGGELFLAVGYTPGGAPFGPRVEIVDGELVFRDELPVDVDAVVELGGEGSSSWNPPPSERDSPF